MWTLATISTPTDEMPLTETLDRFPECEFRVDQSAFETSNSHLSIWFRNVDADELTAALDDDPSVDDYSQVASEGEEMLYNLELDNELIVPMEILQEQEASVEKAHGRGSRWVMEVRFPGREELSNVSDSFEDYDITVDYHSIKSEVGGMGPDGLTENQREVLQLAVEEGYYEIPREATLKELAEIRGVSHQSLSEMLRRAQEELATSRVTSEGRPSVVGE